MFDLPKQLPASIPAVAVGRVKVYINDTGDLVLKDGDTLQETRIEANAVSIITVANDAARLAIASPLLDVIYYQVDTRKFYVYVGGQWKLAGGDIQVYNEANLTALNALPADDKKTNAVYIAQDTNFVYRWNGSTFVLIGGEVQVYQAANLTALSALPAADKKLRAIYVAQDSNYLYRWNGVDSFVQVGGEVQVYQALNLTAIQALPLVERKVNAVYISTSDSQIYRWDVALNVFVRLTTRHTTGSAFPTDPVRGDSFFDTDNDTLFIRTNDGGSDIWLDVSSSGGAVTALPKVTRFTTSGSWTPSAGMKYAVIEGVGAGGAGNTASSSGTTTSVSAGGGAGGYFKTIVSAAQLGAGSRTVTIGAGALASPGGDTTVQGIATANGGQIGERTEIPQGSQNAIFRALPYFAKGGTPGAASVILGQTVVAKRGGVGARGFLQNNAGQGGDFVAYMRGFGGQSEFGSSLDQSYSNVSNGQNVSVPAEAVAADQYGAGGNGAFTIGNAGANGSAGVGGIVVITEFF